MQINSIEPNSLVGLQLENGWKVVDYMPPRNTTGGNFSIAFKASHETGKEGFVKVVDFRRAMASADPSKALEPLIAEFEFERFLLEECRRVRGVVTAIDSGKVEVDGYPVQYLIFDLADGDLRQTRLGPNKAEPVSLLTLARDVTNALRGLHLRKISHQDIKPSNVLIFDSSNARISDLGRACHMNHSGPFDHLDFPGQLNYAPPEFQYRWFASDWATRRKSADLFMLGSMLAFVFSGSTMNSLLYSELPVDATPSHWSATYEEVQPYLINAQQRSIERIKHELNTYMSGEASLDVIQILNLLCNPDPVLRGHPTAHRQGDPYDLQRFVSALDLAKRKQILRGAR